MMGQSEAWNAVERLASEVGWVKVGKWLVGLIGRG